MGMGEILSQPWEIQDMGSHRAAVKSISYCQNVRKKFDGHFYKKLYKHFDRNL